MSHADEVKDLRKVCQVCAAKDTREYQVVERQPEGFFREEAKFDLCEVCGTKFCDNIQPMVPEIVKGSIDCG